MSELPPEHDLNDEASDTVGIDEALEASSEDAPPAPTLPTNGEMEPDRRLALGNEEANALAARRRPTVLVLAGQPDSGKTSAYAAIYERLSRGPFAGRLFAGSQTIAGFEARCHFWRTSSQLTTPAMEHTRADALPWLHLRLRDAEREQPVHDLLFGDFDGEFFGQLLRNEKTAAELPFLRRADHVGVVLNGARLAASATRDAELSDTTYLVDALLADGGLASPEALLLLVTKLDLIEEVSDKTERKRIDDAIAEFHSHVTSEVRAEVPVVRLAVLSATDRFPLGHGLESLLEVLTVQPALRVPTPPPTLETSGPLSGFRA